RFSRILSGGYAVFPLAGQRHIFVQVPLDASVEPRHYAFWSRREFTGRVVTLGQLGSRFHPVRRHLAETMGLPVTSETFLVLADEGPSSYAWALWVAALCVGFALLNLAFMIRWFRPLR